MSCLLCCFRCLSFLGCRDCLLRNAAFHPPEDRYEFGQDAKSENGPITTIILKDPKGGKFIPTTPKGLESTYCWVQTKTNNFRPVVFFRNPQNKSNFVLLYSHGNSTDLGKMRIMLEDLAIILNVHIIAYEYQGYGPSKEKPSDLEMIFDIMAVYDFLIEKLKFKWYEIILYGRSIGGGPTIYLASHPRYPVTGVILHAPFASGLRIFKFDQKSTLNTDLFPNIDFIEHVKANVFIMHGSDDIEVPVKHSKSLAGKVQRLYDTWWVEGGTHNDIDFKFRSSYYIRIAKFLQFLKQATENKSEQTLKEMYQVSDWHNNSKHIYFTMGPKIEQKAKLLPPKNPKEYSSNYYGSNGSLLTTPNQTNATLRNNSELMITYGDQPNAKTVYETNRTEEEERKEYVPPSLSDKKEVEMSFSYSSRKGDLMGYAESDRKMLTSDVEIDTDGENNTSKKRSKATSKDSLD